jgi:hypothetical protein
LAHTHAGSLQEGSIAEGSLHDGPRQEEPLQPSIVDQLTTGGHDRAADRLRRSRQQALACPTESDKTSRQMTAIRT